MGPLGLSPTYLTNSFAVTIYLLNSTFVSVTQRLNSFELVYVLVAHYYRPRITEEDGSKHQNSTTHFFHIICRYGYFQEIFVFHL